MTGELPSGNRLALLIPDDPLEAALAYAALGWPILPVFGITAGRCACRSGPDCPHPGKHPLTHHGLHDATTDRHRIRRWWAVHPDANVAVRTGAPSGLVVVDIDPPHGGDNTIDQHLRAGTIAPAGLHTLTAASGGGGTHLYYRHPDPASTIRNTTGRLANLGVTPGIDLRADGGSVIVPPSTHHTGRRYRWQPNSPPPSPLPEWAAAPPPADNPSMKTRRVQPVRADRYVRAALQGELAIVRAAAEGTRNTTLNGAAYRIGTLTSPGATDQAAVARLLIDAAVDAGLGQAEAARTVHAALMAGAGHPRLAAVRVPAPPPITVPLIEGGREGIT